MCLYSACSDLHQETFLPMPWFLLGFYSDAVPGCQVDVCCCTHYKTYRIRQKHNGPGNLSNWLKHRAAQVPDRTITIPWELQRERGGEVGESWRKRVWAEKGWGKANKGQDEGKEGVKICRRADVFGIKKETMVHNQQVMYCQNTLHFYKYFIKRSTGWGSYNQLRQKEIIITGWSAFWS